jgi:hypothetical protein
MKSPRDIYLQELQEDSHQEKKLIFKEAIVIFILILLSIIREVYFHE